MTSGRKNGNMGRNATLILGTLLVSVLAGIPLPTAAGPSGSDAGYGFYDYTGACYDITTNLTVTENISFTSGSCILQGNLRIEAGYTFSLKNTVLTVTDPGLGAHIIITVNGTLLVDSSTITKSAAPSWSMYTFPHPGMRVDVTNHSFIEGAFQFQISWGDINSTVRNSTFRNFRNDLGSSSTMLLMASCNNITVENNVFSGGNMSIYTTTGRDNVFRNNVFRDNNASAGFNVGTFTVDWEDNDIMEGCTFLNNSQGFGATQGSKVRLLNSTFINNTNDLQAELNAEIYVHNSNAKNLTIDKQSIVFLSHIYWFNWVDVNVTWESDGSPAVGANVTILNSKNTKLMNNNLTNSQGRIEDIELMYWEDAEWFTNNFTPHRFFVNTTRGGKSYNQTVLQDINQTPNVNIILADAPPTLNLTNPVNGTVTGNLTIFVNGTTNPANNVSVFNGAAALNATVNATGYFELSVPLTLEGENTINVTAEDKWGIKVWAVRKVFRDTTPPDLTVLEPAEGLITNINHTRLSGTTDIGSNVSYVVTGLTSSQKVYIPVAANGSFSVLVVISEGKNTIMVWAKDAFGNERSVMRNVTLDTEAPTITITSPTKMTLSTNDPQLRLAGTADGQATRVTVDGTDVTLFGTSFNRTMTLKEGSQDIVIRAYDAAGNMASVTLHATLDTIAPSLFVTSPVNGSLTNLADVAVEGTAEVGSLLTIDDASVELDSGGHFTSAMVITEGINVIHVKATDAVGNLAGVDVRVTLDTTIPLLKITSHKDGQFVNTPEITLSGIIDMDATMTVNGAPVTQTMGLFSHDITLIEGENLIVAKAIDGAGNEASVTLYINLDTQVKLQLDTIKDEVETDFVTIAGLTDTDATLTINGEKVTVNKDGDFETNVPLSVGKNTLVITAKDPYENTNSVTVNVTRAKAAGPGDTGVSSLGLPTVMILLVVLVLVAVVAVMYFMKDRNERSEELARERSRERARSRKSYRPEDDEEEEEEEEEEAEGEEGEEEADEDNVEEEETSYEELDEEDGGR